MHHFNAPDNTSRGSQNNLRPPHGLFWTGQCERTPLLHPTHCALKHTQVHPPALAFVPAAFMPSSSGIFPRHPDSSFILASNFCACPLPQAFCILCSSPLTAFSLRFWVSLALSLRLRIPVSYFEIQPDSLWAAPLGRDCPAIAAKKKKCFAIKTRMAQSPLCAAFPFSGLNI